MCEAAVLIPCPSLSSTHLLSHRQAIADAGHEMDNTLTDLKIALGLGA